MLINDEARASSQLTQQFSPSLSPPPVLAIRFALFASLGAIALWGLFSLLDNLKEPELLRSAHAVVLKGCDPIESPEAATLCAALRCQKQLLDSKAVPLSTRFQVDDERATDTVRLVTGQALAADSSEVQFFACTIERDVDVIAKLSTREEVAALRSQDGGWTLESDP
jgi:hypothetical protein